MNHKTVMSPFFIAVWHPKVIDKEAARHADCESQKGNFYSNFYSIPADLSCVHTTAPQN